MRVRVKSGIDDLASDMAAIGPRAAKIMTGVVREGLKTGNGLAKDFARESSGRAGKHYPKSFTTEMHGRLSALTGGALISGEYGPDESGPQGGMSFEHGSRNQKPHLDLARSADIIAPVFGREVLTRIDELFW